MEAREGRRVAITGVGILAPCGIGAEAFWAGLSKPAESETNRSIDDFDAAEWGLKHVDMRRIDRFAQLAIAASTLARRDAGIEEDSPYDPYRCGVMMGTGIGGAYAWETNAELLMAKGVKYISPLVVPMVMPNAASAHVSIRSGFVGPVETITTACAAGTHAIGHGARLIASGRADVVLAGGSESCQTPIMNNGFLNMKALSPSGISRPFDIARDGFCSAEAAAVLVLEEYEAAKARGAAIYAEIAGTASTADAHHITAPSPNGAGAVACMRAALGDAGVNADEVTHVNAHGTSTQLNDAAEAIAVREVFAGTRPAVTSIKGVTGHSLGAAGAVEAVAVALSYRHRELPPTMHVTELDPEIDIDVVLEPRSWDPAPAVSNSFAFGGHNGTLVFRPI
ncbi:MAG: beta-ketoacyl-[acyl-carrier-protein] synthase family protein [Geodermatophilaceae bacterium]|nr:beta-ketoacyl-[acyl-carrier-protein] synthase family protein [Geodermatophilaceae bacterium]